MNSRQRSQLVQGHGRKELSQCGDGLRGSGERCAMISGRRQDQSSGSSRL